MGYGLDSESRRYHARLLKQQLRSEKLGMTEVMISK